jgi:hypothetical protein
MRFYTAESIFKEAQQNGYALENEKGHAQVIYNYLSEFCLNEEIKSHYRHLKINVVLPDTDDVSCVFYKENSKALHTMIYMGKPEVVSGYSHSGQKLDKSIIRNISLTDFWGAIKDMFNEYQILVVYDILPPKQRDTMYEI